MLHISGSTTSSQGNLPMNGVHAGENFSHNLCASAGTTISLTNGMSKRKYIVLSGEIVILRNGQIVDLVETGEILDPTFWPGTVAVAWHLSVLQPLN
jgi:hypothetical protein